MSAGLESFSREIAAKPVAQQAAAIQVAVNAMPEEMKAAVATALGTRVPEPDQSTSNRVWLIIIGSFALVMVGSVFVLSLGLFRAPVPGGTKPDMILTIFTTTTAFLAGLFAPSPVAKKE